VHEAAVLADAALAAIERGVLSVTSELVARGNKIFGGAVLRDADLSLVVAGSNEEIECPLWHGEISTIRRFYEMAAASRPVPAECVFVSTHEPCAMCLSAIAWAGFPRIIYLFDYRQTSADFDIPHDLDMLAEVFGCSDGAYARENAYWRSESIGELIDACSAEDGAVLRQRVDSLTEVYRRLSAIYQSTKRSQQGTIPLP